MCCADPASIAGKLTKASWGREVWSTVVKLTIEPPKMEVITLFSSSKLGPIRNQMNTSPAQGPGAARRRAFKNFQFS